MEVYRISIETYASKLTASGSANRWNKRDQFVLYSGSSRSLSTLELIVHKTAIIPKVTYKVMVISIADYDHLIKQVQKKDLPKDWRMVSAIPILQQIGSDWYTNKESLVLKIPSAVIINEFNYIINTEHPEFLDNINLVRQENYFWDDRLF